MTPITEKGTVTVGFGTDQERKLEVVDFVRAVYVDDRIVSISELEDGSMVAMVQNIPFSDKNDRAEQAQIWLTKESFVALLATTFLYYQCKRVDMLALLEETIGKQELDYYFSDNLKPFK